VFLHQDSGRNGDSQCALSMDPTLDGPSGSALVTVPDFSSHVTEELRDGACRQDAGTQECVRHSEQSDWPPFCRRWTSIFPGGFENGCNGRQRQQQR
jgi:hypothetical protein